MSSRDEVSRPRFYGGPLDGERVPIIGSAWPEALRPARCDNGFYILRDKGRYEWREVPELDPLA